MRVLLIALGTFAVSSVRTCGKDDSAATGSVAASANASAEAPRGAEAPAPTAAKAELRTPRIGGSVALVGEFSVEVLVHESGHVEALVSDASGKALTEGKLSVQAQGSAGTESIELAFAPASGRFEGRAKAGVRLKSGPVRVSCAMAGGKTAEGMLSMVAALPSPKFGGHVLALGAFSAEVFARPRGELQAFVRDSAGADLESEAKVEASIGTNGGATADIALAYEPPRACFVGHAKAGVEFAPGPFKLGVGGQTGATVGGLERLALTVDATHGGDVVAVGDYSLELVAKGPEIKAFAFDGSGKAHVAGDLSLKLDVGAEPATSLTLAWNAAELCYKARAKAGVNLALQPIRVTLSGGGKMFVGGVASLKALAGAKLAASAKLDADVKADADAKLGARADAKIGAPSVKAKVDASAAKAATASAKVQVTPPKVNINVNKSATAGAKAGGGAKASAGFKLGR